MDEELEQAVLSFYEWGKPSLSGRTFSHASARRSVGNYSNARGAKRWRAFTGYTPT
jgi:hypothetical protein